MTVSDGGAPLAGRTRKSQGPLPLRIARWAPLAAAGLDMSLGMGAALLLARACGISACAIATDEAARTGLVMGLLFVVFGMNSHGYSRAALLRPPFALLVANWLKACLLAGIVALLVEGGAGPLAPLALTMFLGLMAVLAGRELLALGLSAAYGRGVLAPYRTLALARTKKEAQALARDLAADPDCQPVAALAADAVADLPQAGIDRIVVKTGGLAREDLTELLDKLRSHGAAVHFLAGAPRLTGFHRPTDEMGALPVIAVKREPLTRLERAAKRAFDLALACLALALLAPVLLAVALTLRASGRPVLRREPCVGFDGRSFALFSFACPDNVDPAPEEAGLLVRSGLSGLPRLLNVIRGDVSLVGPRPLGANPGDADRKVARFAARQGMKPGLAHGFVVESPLGVPLQPADRRRLRSDELAYLDQWSLMLDLAVLAGGLGQSCMGPDRLPA